jgi:gliding motility-associated-like protein
MNSRSSTQNNPAWFLTSGIMTLMVLGMLLTGPIQTAHGQCTGAAGPDQTFSCNTGTVVSVTMAATGTGKWTQPTYNPGSVIITDTFSPITTITGFSLPGTYSFIWTDTSTMCADTVNVIINNQCECFNLNFSDGTFTGWTGTYSHTGGCPAPNPYLNPGINQGPLNYQSNSSTTQWSQIITSTAGGNEPYLASQGVNIPVAYPGGSGYSARIGNTWPQNGNPYGSDAESISFTYNVTAANAGFTYYYFPILNDGSNTHTAAEQPYFKIRMVANGTDTIACATFDVDASNAASVGGFNSVNDPTSYHPGYPVDNVYYKPWTAVYVPLGLYIGQTVKATFTTRSCISPDCFLGIVGYHFAIAYIYAQCGPVALEAVPHNTCTQNGYTITAPVGMRTYAWSGPGISNDTTISISVTQSGQYTVTMTPFGATPCPFTLDTIIVIDTIPAYKANFSHDSTCLGDTIHFHDLSTPVGLVASWAWDFHNTGTINSTVQNPSYTFPSAGTYQVKLTVVSTTGCTSDTVIPVTVYPLPTPTISQTSTNNCGGYKDTLTAYSGVSYIWSTGSNKDTTTVSPLVDSTYTVTVTDAHTCSATAAIRLTVITPPTATITPTPPQICFGKNDTLTTGVGAGYHWSNGANTIAIIVSPASNTPYSVTVTGGNGCTASATDTVIVDSLPTSAIILSSEQICSGSKDTLTARGGVSYTWSNAANTDTTIVSPTTTTPYSVTVTDINHCTASATDTVTVIPLPTPGITLSSAHICSGHSDTMTASGGISYAWSNGANTDTTTVSPATTTPYSVTVTGANTCTASATISVIVDPLPIPGIISEAPQICFGNTDTLTAGGGVSYAWSNSATTASTAVSPDTTTAYTVTVTGANTCTASDTITVIVNPLPTPVITLSSAQVCSGNKDTLTASGGVTYAWSNAANTDTNIVSPAATTQYIVTVTDAHSCSDTASKTVIVIPLPTPSVTPAAPQICFGSGTTLTAAGGIGFRWSNAANTDTTTVSPLTTTTYSVTVTDANNCSAAATATVTVTPLPTLSVGPDTVICTQLSYNIPGLTSASSIIWSPDSALSNANIVAPVFHYPDSMNFSYTVIAIDTVTGCADTVHVNIGSQPCVSYIDGPQAFSPNGDYSNDFYTLFASHIAKYDIRIYNRWGELVYESTDLSVLNDMNKGWDGNYHGKPQPIGVFVYYITATDNFNNPISKKGNITLLR